MSDFCTYCDSTYCVCGGVGDSLATAPAVSTPPMGTVQPVAEGNGAGAPFIPPDSRAHLHTPPTDPPRLAREQDILSEFGCALRVCGVVGEAHNAQLIYLGLTSRLLPKPVSLAVKGESGSGKSFTTETTLKFFPESAYIEMTAMSERALIYMKEEFAHRTLVLYEAIALRERSEKDENNLTSYFVRSLLSEGRIKYPVTVRDKDGWVTKTIVKNGPTNLIVTTTATNLHGENETRLISLPTNDSASQTRAILLQLAAGKPADVDFTEWHRLQEWLQTANHKVDIPYAKYLAENVPPVAIRLRRDFGSILRLIETHAILHQCSRETDEQGRIVATEADYVAVRDLVADLIADGVGVTVVPTTRETVECVRDLAPTHPEGVSVRAVAKSLDLDRSAAQRRLKTARERGYIKNQEERRGQPARYVIGDPLPSETELLPKGVQHTPDPLCTGLCDKSAGQEGVCTCARETEGVEGAGVGEHRECDYNGCADPVVLTAYWGESFCRPHFKQVANEREGATS